MRLSLTVWHQSNPPPGQISRPLSEVSQAQLLLGATCPQVTAAQEEVMRPIQFKAPYIPLCKCLFYRWRNHLYFFFFSVSSFEYLYQDWTYISLAKKKASLNRNNMMHNLESRHHLWYIIQMFPDFINILETMWLWDSLYCWATNTKIFTNYYGPLFAITIKELVLAGK